MIALVKAAILPSNIIALLAAAGLLLACFRRLRSAGLRMLGVAAACFLVFGNGIVATLLISPLEYAYPALKDLRPFADARHIVVLTAYVSADPEMPTSGNLGTSAAFRVLEAARIFHLDATRTIVISGSEIAARGMAAQLSDMGIPPERVVLETRSSTTAESAVNLRAIVGDGRAILVTSAGHMRRSLEAMSRNGINAIPCPTDYQLPHDWTSASWLPSPIHLLASDLAIHERIGLLWYRIRDGA